MDATESGSATTTRKRQRSEVGTFGLLFLIIGVTQIVVGVRDEKKRALAGIGFLFIIFGIVLVAFALIAAVSNKDLF